jgi:purine-binding chemotaxis protein CheW
MSLPQERGAADIATIPIVVFAAGTHCCGIAVAAVEGITLAVEVSPVPDAPPAVLGVVNFHGSLVAVVDPSRRFGDVGSEIDPRNRLVFVRTPARLLALLATSIEGVEELPAAMIVGMEQLVPGAGRLKGAAARRDGLVYLYDAELLLTQAEETSLAAALQRRQT